MCVSRCVCVTSRGNRQQLQDPEVEPDLDQDDGPGQQDEVDVAGSAGALLSGEEACGKRAREAGRGGQRPDGLGAILKDKKFRFQVYYKTTVDQSAVQAI